MTARTIARDTAYIAVGLGVLGFQKAQVRRRELADRYPDVHSRLQRQLNTGLDAVDSMIDAVVDPAVARLSEALPATAATAVTRVHSAGKHTRQQLRSAITL